MKTALITGGTSGIGAGISHHLSRTGYHVIACGFSVKNLMSRQRPLLNK